MSDEKQGWAILELMGHRRLAGYVSEAEWPVGFVRIDIPGEDDGQGKPESQWPGAATQKYNPSAVYCLTPCSEATARKVAKMARPAPVASWELPQLEPGNDEPEEPKDW